LAPQKPKKPAKPKNYTVSGSPGSRTKTSAKAAKSSAAKAGTARAAKTSKVSASKSAVSRKKPAPNMQERMEGLQGWMAEIERKQGRMTYFGAAAALVAIAASAGALYLAVTTKDDSATKEDVEAISGQVNAIQGEVKRAVEKELKLTNDKIATLEQSVEDLQKKQAQDAADIATLQKNQSSSARGGGGAGARAGAGVGANSRP
jgi:hypothetical protein